jgi:signal transduction histidine kinase
VQPNSISFRTSSFRLALIYAAVFVALATVLFAMTYWLATTYAARDETNEIAEEYTDIQDEIRLAGIQWLPEIIDNHIARRKNVRAVYLLQDAAGRKIAGNLPEMTPRLGATTVSSRIRGELVSVRARGYLLPDGDYLLIGQDTSTLQEMKETIAQSFGVGIALTLIFAVFGGALISTTVLKRVETVSRTARGIIDGDLTNRVPLRDTRDEFDELGATVNAMLDRIEDLMRSMRQVSSDIAHDLRTPLTRLRQRLERAHRSSDAAELHAALDAAIVQVDAILETFSALLRIAQVEAGGSAAAHAEVNVSKLLRTIVEDFSPAAEDHGQRLTADIGDNLMLPGDRELITQMIVNLVDNAIRHSKPGTDIRVQGWRSGEDVTLAVADTGPGIPEQEREKVLRPFYRLESSRTTDGSGLGLSLVAAIAKRHRARLALLDNNPGLRVLLQFPLG